MVEAFVTDGLALGIKFCLWSGLGWVGLGCTESFSTPFSVGGRGQGNQWEMGSIPRDWIDGRTSNAHTARQDKTRQDMADR